MFRTISAALVLVLSALTLPQTAHAISVTIDDTALTVVRPLSGATQVDFTGSVTATDGFEVDVVSLTPVYNEFGDSLALSMFPQVSGQLNGVLFSLIVSATDALGTYAYFTPPTDLASLTYFECPIGGGLCDGSGPIHYSLNVVAAAVPEASTLALFGLGALSLVAVRLRRPRRQMVRAA